MDGLGAEEQHDLAETLAGCLRQLRRQSAVGEKGWKQGSSYKAIAEFRQEIMMVWPHVDHSW